MNQPVRIVTDSMIGLKLPDYARHSARVATVLGHNPGPFTGPGTNTWLVGSGSRPILLDTGQGVPIWGDLLVIALKELCGSSGLDRIVLTHAHVDHIGGVKQVSERFGEIEVLKMPWAGHDAAAGIRLTAIGDNAVVKGEGVSLRAIHTPGHAPDHLCYYLEEERAVFTGDVVLGAGTTVIPDDTGDLGQYMNSLNRLLELDLETIYPAHGPVIRKPKEKIREYIAHRELRERQVLDALTGGPLEVMAIVKKIYVDVPEYLHPAAASSVRSHLKKLGKEGRVAEHEHRWSINRG
jgi:glyoxylase-like metal-dependent hydrolase (beta-lactamase superfamily II)